MADWRPHCLTPDPSPLLLPSTLSQQVVPLCLSLLDSLALSSYTHSTAGFAPPLSTDELRALGDNIPSPSLYPKSLKTGKGNPQKVGRVGCWGLTAETFSRKPPCLMGVTVVPMPFLGVATSNDRWMWDTVSQLSSFSWGQLQRAILTLELPVGLGEASVAAASQFNSSLSQILLSSLPNRCWSQEPSPINALHAPWRLGFPGLSPSAEVNQTSLHMASPAEWQSEASCRLWSPTCPVLHSSCLPGLWYRQVHTDSLSFILSLEFPLECSSVHYCVYGIHLYLQPTTGLCSSCNTSTISGNASECLNLGPKSCQSCS